MRLSLVRSTQCGRTAITQPSADDYVIAQVRVTAEDADGAYVTRQLLDFLASARLRPTDAGVALRSPLVDRLAAAV